MNKRRIDKFFIIDIPAQTEVERKELFRTIIIMTTGIFLTIAIVISLVSAFKIVKLAMELPEADLLKAHKPDQTTLIYDINDKLIANIHGDEDRVVVSLDKISPHLQRAVIAVEDNRFYSHKGIDLIGTIRAGFNNCVNDSGSLQGGSTLTQQLVKNSFLSSERSLKRKLIEAILAIRVEKNFSKDKILEMYLNQIYWGNLSYGAEKAARRYFKKSAGELDLAESALLAGLIKAPEGYSPYSNFKQAKLRQKLVLAKMEQNGYITHNQRIKAEIKPLKFLSAEQRYSKYPYFIDYIVYLLRLNYGEGVVRRGGLRVYTTINPAIQELAQKVIEEGVKSVPKGSGVTQGALVSINVDNGYIQALVGGVDFKKSNFNRAVFAKRAAGSSFKPVVYLTGLRVGKITPESPIVDAPISFNTGWNIWSPHNWDGKYMGKMTVRKALTLSRNTPTVRVALKVGVELIIETARLLGIKSPIKRNFSIALGSAGVSPLEMATVYSTLARSGTYIEPTAIRRIEDSDFNLLEEHSPNPIQVVSPNFVTQLNSILIDVVEKGTGKQAKLVDRTVAGKTGTTDDVRDIWFSGFTPDTATVIWMGNDQNTSLQGVFSSNCAELWGMFSKEYYNTQNIAPRYFRVNDKFMSVKIDKKDSKNKTKLSLIGKDKNEKYKKRKTSSFRKSFNNTSLREAQNTMKDNSDKMLNEDKAELMPKSERNQIYKPVPTHEPVPQNKIEQENSIETQANSKLYLRPKRIIEYNQTEQKPNKYGRYNDYR